MTLALALVALSWALAAGRLVSARRARRVPSTAPSQGLARWLVAGAGLTVAVCVLAAGLRLVGGRPDELAAVMVAATSAVPLALALGMGRAATRDPATGQAAMAAAVHLAGLATLAVGAYLVVAVGPSGLPGDAEQALAAWSLVAALVTAVAAPTVARTLGRWAGDLVPASGDAPVEAALRSFGGRMTRAVPMEELLLQLAETVRRSFAGRRGEVWLLEGDRLVCHAAVPHRRPPPIVLDDRLSTLATTTRVAGGAWARTWLPELGVDQDDPGRLRCVPLTHRGRMLGLLVAERTVSQPPFGDQDDRTLADLARQLGTALRNVQLDSALQATVDTLRRRNAELQESRTRIVSAADAERRRLERDLHDGAQQHLTALTVKLELAAASGALGDDPALADDLRRDLDEARRQLRDLAHGIFPPLLSIGGLGDALPGLAARAPLSVTVEVGTVRYPTEVEAAVYFCCAEALQNAAKHAGPDAHAHLQVWEADGSLQFTLTDDGPGFEAGQGPHAASELVGARAHHGLANMADRLGAVGGELAVTSAPGAGTTVAGRVPLP